MAENLFFAFLLGVLLGAVYDFFRLLRYVSGLHFILDILFWLISAFSVFSYLLIFDNGSIRGIYFFVIFFGLVLYMMSFGYIFKNAELKVSKKIKIRLKKVKKKLKSFKKVLQSYYNLYYNNTVRIFTKLLHNKRNVKDGKNQQYENQ